MRRHPVHGVFASSGEPTIVFLTERWKVKSNSSKLLRAGKRAALMRPSPPWLSREATRIEMLKAAVAFVEKYDPPN